MARLDVHLALEKSATPCSEAKEEQLDKNDALISAHAEQIKEWYKIACDNDDWRKFSTPKYEALLTRVLETYRHRPERSGISRFCAHRNYLGEDFSGVDLTEHLGRQAYTLFPTAFEYKGQSDLCRTIETDIHERTHAVTGIVHEKSTVVDPPNLFGSVARLVCIDRENPTDEALTVRQRYSRTLKILSATIEKENL